MKADAALLSAVPALPVSRIPAAVAFYESRLGFTRRHVEDSFAIVARDGVEIHLWAADDPDVPGAEPHLAGTASCRIRMRGVRTLYAQCERDGIVHPNGALSRQPWGTEEFTVVDVDNNALTFYELLP